MSQTERARAALYDTASALRLIDSTLEDMTGVLPEDPVPTPARPSLPDLSALVEQGHGELVRVLAALRQSRSVLERAAVDRLHQTHDKLKAVSDATEVAATDILNGIERAVSMVDELDTLGGTAEERSADLRGRLREELFGLMGHMQFQDITSQQLAYASAVLVEMEGRLTALVQVFDPVVGEVLSQPHVAGAFDPDASLQDRAQRQALADAIVAAGSRRRAQPGA